jgi:glutamate mutase epsilon subunit
MDKYKFLEFVDNVKLMNLEQLIVLGDKINKEKIQQILSKVNEVKNKQIERSYLERFEFE